MIIDFIDYRWNNKNCSVVGDKEIRILYKKGKLTIYSGDDLIYRNLCCSQDFEIKIKEE